MPTIHRSTFAVALIVTTGWTAAAVAQDTEEAPVEATDPVADPDPVPAPDPDPEPQIAQASPEQGFELLPQYVPDKPRTRRRPYREGMKIPEGYYVEETPKYGLVAAGASIMATLWVISLGTAIALDSQPDGSEDPNFDDMYWPMFIPVAGPFATIATADSSGTGAAILALDGAFQAAGLAMFIAGFLSTNKELVPEEEDIVIAPTFSPEMSGVSLSGRL